MFVLVGERKRIHMPLHLISFIFSTPLIRYTSLRNNLPSSPSPSPPNPPITCARNWSRKIPLITLSFPEEWDSDKWIARRARSRLFLDNKTRNRCNRGIATTGVVYRAMSAVLFERRIVQRHRAFQQHWPVPNGLGPLVDCNSLILLNQSIRINYGDGV